MPSIPGLQEAFEADYGTVQLVLTVYLVGISAGQLVYGPLSDRYGRRPVLLAGLGVYIVGTLACLAAPGIWALVAGRAVQAIGGCAGAVLSRAIIADVYERGRASSMLAYVIMAMVVVPMLAPALGGTLDLWFGWSAGFVVVLLFGAGVLAATFLALPETHHERSAPVGAAGTIRDTAALLLERGFTAHAGQVAFTTAVFFGFLAGAPYVMVEILGRTPAEYGLYFVLVSAAFMAGNFASGRLSVRLGTARMVGAGTAIAVAATGLLLALAASGPITPLTLFGLMGVVALGNGLSVSNGLGAAITYDPKRAGTASGLAGFMQMGFGAAASYVVGLLMADSAAPLVAIMFACAVAALLCHLLAPR